MNDVAYFILVLVVASIVIFGVASFMDKRHKPKVQAPLGNVSQIIQWLSRGMLALTVLAVLGSFTLNQVIYAQLAWSFLIAYILLGIAFQIARHRDQ